MTIGFYGGDGFGSSPYGSVPPQVGVLNATSLGNTSVEVNFTELLDFTYIPLLTVSNYTIPGLIVGGVVQTADNAVLLTTTPQSAILYTVTVGAARSTFARPLNPAENSASFMGTVPVPGFLAVPTSARRVRLIFSASMLHDSNLTDPGNYTIADLNGNTLSVTSVGLEQTIDIVSLVLTLGSNLGESDFYVATVSADVKTTLGLSVLPSTYVFQWLAGDKQFVVPLGLFTGEVSGGLLGDPDGLVFFSPALNESAANSIIQVEDIDVCTTAYDSYVQPSPIDPLPLFLYGGGLVPTPNPDPYLLNQCVLWAPFPRNFEAQITVGFTGNGNQDFYEPPVDTSCSVLMKQQFALGYVALLNDTAWYLFNDMAGTSVPPTFITANNMNPIPAGPESILMLHVQLGGTSSFSPATATKSGLVSSSMAGTSQLFAGAGPPPVVLAQASLSAGSSLVAVMKETFAGSSSLTGVAVVRAVAIEGNPPPTVLAASSAVVATAHVKREVAAHAVGSSGVSAVGSARRGVGASLAAHAGVTPTARAHWEAHAAITGGSTVSATATVTHKSEAFPAGLAEVTATAS